VFHYNQKLGVAIGFTSTFEERANQSSLNREMATGHRTSEWSAIIVKCFTISKQPLCSLYDVCLSHPPLCYAVLIGIEFLVTARLPEQIKGRGMEFRAVVGCWTC